MVEHLPRKCKALGPILSSGKKKDWWLHQARVQSQLLGRQQKTASPWELQARLGSTGRPCLGQQTIKKQLMLGVVGGHPGNRYLVRMPHPHEGEGSPMGEPVWRWLAGQGRGVPAQCAVG